MKHDKIQRIEKTYKQKERKKTVLKSIDTEKQKKSIPEMRAHQRHVYNLFQFM